MTKYKPNPKRLKQEIIQAWFDVENTDDTEILNIFKAFQDQFPNRSKKAIISMAFRALARAKKPHLLLPRESSETMLDRLALSLNEMHDELAQLREAIASGIVIHGNNQAALTRVDELAQELGSLEQSIADTYQPMSFDEDED